MTDPQPQPENRTPSSKAKKAVEDARAKARLARDRALERSRVARSSASKGLEQNPIAALAGGLAIGVIAAAILPHSRREDALLGSTGKKIRTGAKAAVAGAKDAGLSELNGLGVNSDMARAQAKELFGKVGVAARAAGIAATGSVKKGSKKKK